MTAPPIPTYPDAESVLCDLLEVVAATGTKTPNPLVIPFVRVRRVGGSDDGITDFPRIQLSAYGPDRSSSWALAELCRELVVKAAGNAVNGVLVDNARTDTPPQFIDDDSDEADYVDLTFELAFRRQF